MQLIGKVLFGIGAYYAALKVYRIMRYLFNVSLPNSNLVKFYNRGAWVLVTGGTDGIGLQFCKYYARIGVNVVIIARSQQKLLNTVPILEQINNTIQTQIIQMDFSQQISIEKYQQLQQILSNMSIRILVNNVGTGATYFYHLMTQKEIKAQINVNCSAMIIISRLIIPKMLRLKQRSLIINVSSMSSFFEVPFLSNYAATKRFMNQLGDCLRAEYRDKIQVLTIMPQFVTTKMIFNHRGMTSVTTQQLIKNTHKFIGRQQNVVGCLRHKLYKFVFSNLSSGIRQSYMYGYLERVAVKQKKRRQNFK